MRATRFTHVSIQAYDLEESVRFYVETFGMERVPSPDFNRPVEWLQLGDQQLHLFLSDDRAPRYHHIGLDVDDFEAAYRIASERGLFDADAFGASVRELLDGTMQMYLRDPAGNLVEVNWPDASTIDRSIVTDIVHIEDERPQSEEARRATLYGPVAAPHGRD
jgi:catechol 2,3-dioxygenase-like lactoylglutathione lyase family enzyme